MQAEEGGIAKGVRRIVAVTGDAASEAFNNSNEIAAELQSIDRRAADLLREKGGQRGEQEGEQEGVLQAVDKELSLLR